MRIDNRIWAIVSVLVVGAIVAGGWFLGASPLLAARADAEEQLAATRATNDGHAATLLALKEASEDLPKLQERALELETAIPSGLESSPLITAINDLAAATGVTVTAIRISDGVSYQEPVGGGEGEPLEGAPSPLTDARISSDNFVLVPISIEVAGELPAVLSFIHGIQTGKRLVLVTGLDTGTDGEGSTTYTSTITGTTYVLVRPPAFQIGAALAEAENDSDADAPEPETTATPEPGETDDATPAPTGSPTPRP